MSALAERIIAARDDMKRHFASHYVLSVMADESWVWITDAGRRALPAPPASQIKEG